MLYADKVIGLLAAYPGQPFVMRQIIRYIDPAAGRLARMAIQRSVHRVLVALAAMGNVEITKPGMTARYARYVWKTKT